MALLTEYLLCCYPNIFLTYRIREKEVRMQNKKLMGEQKIMSPPSILLLDNLIWLFHLFYISIERHMGTSYLQPIMFVFYLTYIGDIICTAIYLYMEFGPLCFVEEVLYQDNLFS